MRSMQTEIHATYKALRAGVPDSTPVVVLHIGAEQTNVTAGRGPDISETLMLALGSQKTAREFFKHAPPSPLEIEHAIQIVEDEVIRAKALIRASPILLTSDQGLREIALHSGVADAAVMQLGLDAMERTFNRLSAVSLGRPAAQEGLPASTEFAARLLILREFMHHLRFAQLTIVAAHPT